MVHSSGTCSRVVAMLLWWEIRRQWTERVVTSRSSRQGTNLHMLMGCVLDATLTPDNCPSPVPGHAVRPPRYFLVSRHFCFAVSGWSHFGVTVFLWIEPSLVGPTLSTGWIFVLVLTFDCTVTACLVPCVVIIIIPLELSCLNVNVTISLTPTPLQDHLLDPNMSVIPSPWPQHICNTISLTPTHL